MNLVESYRIPNSSIHVLDEWVGYDPKGGKFYYVTVHLDQDPTYQEIPHQEARRYALETLEGISDRGIRLCISVGLLKKEEVQKLQKLQ